MFPGIRDHLNDPDPEGEDVMDLDENSSKGELADHDNMDEDDAVLSVLPLNYAMKMPSPSGNPHRDPISRMKST